MYNIMNKDRIIAEFDYITNELGTAVPIPQLMSKEMYERIGGIRDFSFVSHTNYPVSGERLSALNGFILHRIKRLIEPYNE